MEEYNKKRLFLASCFALITTSMTFAMRARLETVFGPEGIGLTLEQIGYAFGPAFFGFTIAMIIGGPLVDVLGIKKITWLAFITHAIGITLTLFASDLTSLFVATLFVGIGNGMVEAALNPLIASMYDKEKTKMLNRFHVWFPGGIVVGSIIAWLLMDVMGLSWQLTVATVYIPMILYAVLFFGQPIPQTERVKMGISNKDMLKSVFSPLFLFMVFCMLLTSSAELGTTQRIESLLKKSVESPLLILAFINGIMALGRLSAGNIVHRLKPAGMLLYSAVLTFVGFWLLITLQGNMTFIAAAVFALGVTFFWPTMLSFVAENLPETGALGLSIMGGAGMFSVSIVLPIMGSVLDNANAAEALKYMSILPAILIVAFIGLNVFLRKKATAA